MSGIGKRVLATLVAFFVLAGASAAIGARPASADPGSAGAGTLPPPVVRTVPSPASDFVRTAAQPTSTPPAPFPPPPAPPLPSTVDAMPLASAGEVVPVPARGPTPSASSWTTPPEPVPPSWSTVAPVSQPSPSSSTTWSAPPPPPPPRTTATTATSSGAVSLAERCWSGCGLPCQDGLSMWHVRLVGGVAFYEGDDPPDPCGYWGLDFGRTHCGCWGWDLYYRWSSAAFEREAGAGQVTDDGGYTHHVGAKLTWERSFGSSRFYGWVGLGGGYFWTQDYVDDDDGFEIFGEAGVGYVINRNFRVRVGVNAHLMETSVGRRLPADWGSSRWLLLYAPVAELEIDF